MILLKKGFFLAISCLLIQGVLNGQNTPFFKTGDRICFVGNSITHSGEFHHNILLYYTTRFPKRPVTFYNCGISGDITSGVLKRIQCDILIHKPTHAVIMIGMNDVMRQLYGPVPTLNSDTLKKRENALAAYRTNLDSIVRILKSKKVKVILQKPSIYDQTSRLERPNNFGVNDALKSCADYMKLLADKYNLQTVDYWTIMNSINDSMQQKNPSATIVGPDRVHPSSPGNLVMSYQFLKSMSGAKPQIVSMISVNQNLKKSNKESLNCRIKKLKYQNQSINFIAKENSLPFPLVQSQFPALEWLPFIKEFNSQMLRVIGLHQGSYLLKIDSVNVGVFTNAELQECVNLAMNNKTPQYQQALNVREVYLKLWEIESRMRAIKHIEYQHLKDFKHKFDFQSSKQYLDSLFNARFSGSAYLMLQKERFVENKPIEKQLEIQSDSLRAEAYKAAQPKEHLYQIIPLK